MSTTNIGLPKAGADVVNASVSFFLYICVIDCWNPAFCKPKIVSGHCNGRHKCEI